MSGAGERGGAAAGVSGSLGRALASLLLFALLLTASGCIGIARAGAIPDGAFVRARGTEFVFTDETGEHVFRFVGANFDPLHGERERTRYREVMRALKEDGLTVGRIWALGEGPGDSNAWMLKYALFRAGPDGWQEAAYRQLDQVLADAREQGLRLIITLSNHWTDYGGAPMYLTWIGKEHAGLGLEDFYTDIQTRALFRAHLLRLLDRKNTVTGTYYRDDPTIFSWELMNESSVLSPRGQAARRAWIVEMAQLIKSRDPNHMIAAGLLGYSMRKERTEWRRVHQLKWIDYCDSHLYLQDSQGGVTVRRLHDLLDDRAQLARQVIKKPLVIGEFGFRTDGGQTYLGVPRARWFSELLTQHFRNGGAGALVWLYQPYADKPRDYAVYTDSPKVAGAPDTTDVRTALRAVAARLRHGQPFLRNPRIAASTGDRLLYTADMTLNGPVQPHTRWTVQPTSPPEPRALLLRIAPHEYMRARFERVGYWHGAPAAHAYGADEGEFTYRFAAPRTGLPPRLSAIEVDVRLSSEWPGAPAVPGGGSRMHLRIDGAPVAERITETDDGIGRREHFRITDPALLVRLRTGVHTLTFAVPPAPANDRASGLCIYGDYRLRTPDGEPPPAGEFTPILIRYVGAPPAPPPSVIRRQ